DQTGTPLALQAADLFMLLKSPLDALDPKKVTADDRFVAGSPSGLVAVIGDQRLRHWGKARSVAFSTDGKLVASGGDDYVIRIWDAATGVQQRAIQVGSIPTWLTMFSDGKRIATADGRGLKTWDLTTGKDLSAPPGRFLGRS